MSSASGCRGGSCVPGTALFDAERVRLGIAHDRPRAIALRLRLPQARAELPESLDLCLTVVGAEVEVDRIRLRPRLLAPLEEEAGPARRRLARDVEGVGLALVHAGVEQLSDEALVDRLFGPTEGARPELPERDRVRGRERDVADAAYVGVRRRLDA